jgi:hypothetical protein
MRIIVIIALLFYSGNNWAQTKKSGPQDSTYFVNLNIGLNGFSNNASTETAYGVDIAEGTFGFGPFVGLGIEYRLNKKWGFHADAAVLFASRSKKRFIPAFNDFYKEFDVQYEISALDNEVYLTGGLYSNTKFGLSYLFRCKGVGMYPQLVFGMQSSVSHAYSYTLREPGTNYFTNYTVDNKGQWSPYYGAGFTVLFSEYDLAAISGEIGYSTMNNQYTISQSGFNQPITTSEISTSNEKLYWKLSLLLRMDFALMK